MMYLLFLRFLRHLVGDYVGGWLTMLSRIACVVGLGIALLAMLLFGGNQPEFLRRIEIVAFSIVAMAYGYSAFSPRAPALLRSQPVRGVACIYGGVAVIFIDVSLLASALLLGAGCRLCMTSFKQPVVVIRRGDFPLDNPDRLPVKGE